VSFFFSCLSLPTRGGVLIASFGLLLFFFFLLGRRLFWVQQAVSSRGELPKKTKKIECDKKKTEKKRRKSWKKNK
jgi:hypothetical protein